jgi:hypothetical protein
LTAFASRWSYMHWVWTSVSQAPPEPALAGAADEFAFAGLSCDSGLLVRGELPVLDLAPSGVLPESLVDNISVPSFRGLILSNRFRQLLDDVGVDNLQYFPCRIRLAGSAGRPADYVVANVVGRVGCVDREASRLVTDEVDPTIIEFVDVLVFDEKAAGPFDVFRPVELPHLVVVSDRVKAACEAAQITGVRFQAVTEYSG